ncbi:MAG: sigma-E factor negative regulatory protein [Rhodocyclaceae bacterium]|nr:sigma-E factor negative regulatory protein [Rhodocyclaceae bacterium]
MRSEISALLDGELEAHEAQSAFAALRGAGDLRATWDEYQTIGAALRREDRLGAGLAARVMAGLEHDVTVLAPRQHARRAAAWQRPLMALAASVAGVAVVGWVAFSPQLSPTPAGPGHLARTPAAPPAAVASVAPAARREMQEYLVAHQAHVPAAQVLGGTRHIRTVSAADGARR